MNVRIMMLYLMKSDADFNHPSLIFGAKAAPSLLLMKKVIELINGVADVVNDPEISPFMKVVFIENYGVRRRNYYSCDRY